MLRTTAMFRPKIPEVLAAVREAGIIYEKALRALHELPGQIARAEPQSITRWGRRAVRPRAATGLETRLLFEFRLLRVSDLDQSLGILSILHQECGKGRRVPWQPARLPASQGTP